MSGYEIKFGQAVLHLRHKLQYFHDANWDNTWITTATGIVRNEYVWAYMDLPIDEDVVICKEDVSVAIPIAFLHCDSHISFSQLSPPRVTSLMSSHQSPPWSAQP